MNYYVYEYLREDGTPYYVGKGKGTRYKAPHKRGHTCVPIPPIDRVKFHATDLTEDEALDIENILIEEYGIKEEGGLLINQVIHREDKRTFTKETKKKMSDSAKRRGPHGKDVYDKISKSLTGKSRPQETRDKISKSHKGKKHTEETKDKLRADQTKRKLEDPDYYEKLRERGRKGAEARWGKRVDNK